MSPAYTQEMFLGMSGRRALPTGQERTAASIRARTFLGGFMGTDILRSKPQMPELSSRQVACTLMPSVGKLLRLPV